MGLFKTANDVDVVYDNNVMVFPAGHIPRGKPLVTFTDDKLSAIHFDNMLICPLECVSTQVIDGKKFYIVEVTDDDDQCDILSRDSGDIVLKVNS